jgi:transposase
MERSYSETEVKQLIAEAIAPLLARIAELEAEVARLKKNSSNSSKPPSSDIVKPPRPPARQGSGQIGGQPGHPKHEREDLPPEQVDQFRAYHLKRCPDCGHKVRRTKKIGRVLQQLELVACPVLVTEHQAERVWCPRCRKFHDTPLPEALEKAGLLGPRLTALVGWFKSRGHDSYSTMAEFLGDVARRRVSRGLLAKAIQKVSAALEVPYETLTEALVRQERLNVDETGHPENKKRMWTWVFRAADFTVFHIDPSRGSEVLVALLGEQFQGVLGCDYFSAYRKYLGEHHVLVQFCLAHLIRELKFLTTLTDAVTVRWAKQMLAGMRRLFGVIHRRTSMTAEKFQRALARARDVLLARGKRGPARSEVQNLVKRFKEHGDAYFRFVTTPGIQPTNNLAEQALRFVVIDRRLTQGTRSMRGRHWCQRIWSVAATCYQQGRSLFEYLRSAIEAHFAGRPVPSLLASGP